ncbi:hypothetical protein [Paludisphaera rhizosphaerae]|uniref:hypothetical protein n=1 Tax=Paludisphaera rhizosphaerae TaxID=2711216 RepID=UPI0013EADDBF|nr:hypothetical protein [Paludisphaera rhizosphaerae]
MAESTCLHIQDRESGPIRIVELPWISVRVGRAAFCEVRLSDSSLPEEALRLHRRGRAWHLTPLIGSGVTLDGQPVDSPLALPFDVPFQVGRFTLSLKSNRFAEPDWRASRDEPSPTRPRAQAPTPAAPQSPPTSTNPWEARWRAAGDRLKAARAAETRPTPTPEPPPRDVSRPAAPKAEPPRYGAAPHAWTSPTRTPSPTSRPGWEKPKPRATNVEPKRPAPSPPSSRTIANPPSPLVGEGGRRPDEGGPGRPTVTAPLIRPSGAPSPTRGEGGITTRPITTPEERPPVLGPLISLLMLPAPAPAAVEPESPSATNLLSPLPPGEGSRAAADEGRGISEEAWEAGDQPAISCERSDVFPPGGGRQTAQRSDEGDDRRCMEEEAAEFASDADHPPHPALRATFPLQGGRALQTQVTSDESLSARLEAMDLADITAQAPAPVPEPLGPIRRRLPRRLFFRPAPPAIETPEPQTEPDAEPEHEQEHEPAWTYTPQVEPTGSSRRFVADTSYGFEPFDAAPGFAPSSPAATSSPAQAATAPQARRAAVYEEEPETFDPTRARRSQAEEPWVLPSVQDVLGASARRVREREAAGPIPKPSARFAKPAPTRPTPPSHWSAPSWLVGPPALALLLGVGGLLGLGAWRQASVSHNAATVIRSTAGFRRGTDKERALAKGIEPPSPSWWGASPAHLAQWGVYLDGTRVENEFETTAPAMLEAAAAASPLEPVARLTLARGRGEGTPTVGLSRDAVGLAWTGRTLHKAGKNAEAVRVYRRALEIAARTRPDSSSPLTYSNDKDVPRYLLPGEALAAAVVADLAADASWSYRDWSEAVPESGVSALAVARMLKKQGKPEADAILKRILERAEAEARGRAEAADRPSDDPEAEAVSIAVAAEALALRADWKEAEHRYRAAIDLMPDHRIRRSWWFNLADVALKIGDDDQHRAALDEALASTAADDVSRRALQLQGGPATRSGTNRLGSAGPKAN